MSRITVDEYLRRPAGAGRRELAYGIVRVPPAPNAGHQSTATRLAALVDQHVRRHGLGSVYASPVDVVLDRERALIVQPDLVFVSHERAESGARVGDARPAEAEPVAPAGPGTARRSPRRQVRIWGAPDLIVEVLSLGTARHQRVTKLAWYRKYGVRECWLVDPLAQTVEVLDLARGQDEGARRLYRDAIPVCSYVLGPLAVRTARLFRSGPAHV